MIIVSACLAGVNCRHDGCMLENALIKKLVGTRKAIPLCPEVMSGRPVPRLPVEISGGSGRDVLSGKARIVDKNGSDITDDTLSGVNMVIAAVKRMDIKTVILKSKSPTCGYGKIFDGTFSGKLVEGHGVLTAALLNEGIKVFTEKNCEALIDELLEK